MDHAAATPPEQATSLGGTAVPQSAAQRIEAALSEEIGAGLHGPGERLDETRLAKRFGTSRTPVREALGRLESNGVLVRGEGGRGLRVASYGREQLAQMFEAMQEIEAVCAGLAARRLTLLARAEIEAADAACRAAAEADDRIAYLRANEGFHLAIYRATQNPYVESVAAEFRRRTGPFRAAKFAAQADLLSSCAGHRQLMALIFAADAEGAGENMRDHLRRVSLSVLTAN